MTDAACSPAASTIPGTTITLHTPPPDDTQSDERNVAPGGQAMDDAISSSPDSSSQRGQEIQLTRPSKMDQTNIRAHVFWQREQHMDNVLLDLNWDGQHNHAFFRLHTGLRLEGAPAASQRGLINAYIFVYPERIRRLSFTALPQHSPFNLATIALTFELNRRPALVLPKTYISLGQGAEETVRSLRSLVQQLNFTVYASLPSTSLSITWLQQFCNDITEQKLTTIAPLANLNTLYQGQGAQVIEGDGLPEAVDDQDYALTAQELPAYQETDPSIPLARSARRRRLSDESSATDDDAELIDTVIMQALFEDRLEIRLAAHKRKLGEMLSAYEYKLNEMISAHRRKINAQVAACKSDVEKKIKSAEKRLKRDAMNERMHEELDEV